MSTVGATLGHKKVGCLGGGQLGRMMAYKAHQMGVSLTCLDPKGDVSPSGQVTACLKGSFNDPTSIRKLAESCDVVTVEIEHVDTVTLDELVVGGKDVQPSPETIRLIQDKYVQKLHLQKHGIALAEFVNAPTLESISEAGKVFGYPLMLKSKRLAYDGKGNAVVKTEENIQEAFKKLGGHVGNELYVEKWAPFVKELAIMVVRGIDDEIKTYPVVETVQKDNICHTVLAPAQVSEYSMLRALEIAQLAILTLPGRGIYGVELFLLPNNDVVLNEIAPRPHNSGHFTIEACETDQFEQHLRAIMGLPLGSTDLKVGASMMINIVGTGADKKAEEELIEVMTTKSLNTLGASIHWYGKGLPTLGRKMGHVTIVAKNVESLRERIKDWGVEI